MVRTARVAVLIPRIALVEHLPCQAYRTPLAPAAPLGSCRSLTLIFELPGH